MAKPAPSPAAKGPGKAPGRAAPDKSRRAPASVAVEGIRLTHPDRMLWRDAGVTKQGLAEFYAATADRLLPHIVDRPLTLVRCPAGTGEKCFFQKHGWAGLNPQVRRTVLRHGDKDEEVLHVDGLAGVVALVQAGVLELHPWGSALTDVERPDRIVFDFDPAEGLPWRAVTDAAREVRSRLCDLGLEAFLKTTGGKGLHVVVPLTPEADWERAKAFSRSIAEAMEADSPDRYLTKASKSERTGRVFIDYLRNARGAHAVAPYSTRARPGAPVSTPLAWEELTETRETNQFTVASLGARLGTLKADPWADFFTVKQRLPAVRRP